MLKKLTMISIASAILLLSGCASKPSVTISNDKQQNTEYAYIEVRNGAGAPSWAYNESKAFRNVLEAAATTTLQKGYKYFAIKYPKEISNLNGSLANTAKELIAKCDPNGLLILNVPGAGGLHKCGANNTNAELGIIMFNEEQEKYTVIDAQKVIEYMKENNLYDDNGIDIK